MAQTIAEQIEALEIVLARRDVVGVARETLEAKLSELAAKQGTRYSKTITLDGATVTAGSLVYKPQTPSPYDIGKYHGNETLGVKSFKVCAVAASGRQLCLDPGHGGRHSWVEIAWGSGPAYYGTRGAAIEALRKQVVKVMDEQQEKIEEAQRVKDRFGQLLQDPIFNRAVVVQFLPAESQDGTS